MAQKSLDTPKANRVHIGFFGRCNAGKSSLLNAIAAQPVSIVSETAGTTTDPVEKAMELLPIGSVLLLDTPGLDDTTELGTKRMEATNRVLRHTDLAVVVLDSTQGETEQERTLYKTLKERQIPYIMVWNKWDKAEKKPIPENAIPVSTKTGEGIDTVKERLIALYQQEAPVERKLFGSFLSPCDLVLLVTPIDSSAPKGRMILPQVQAIRSILDERAICLVTQPEELIPCLKMLRTPPKLIVTDSQAFHFVKSLVPNGTLLTSFSILFAAYKGVLQTALQSIDALEQLPEGSRILIAEGCTHHRQCEDIGTVKLPHWIQKHTGRNFQFSFSSGNHFPESLSEYKLVVHCGGCMLHEKEMAFRAEQAKKQGVPFLNYGILIAHLNGILKQSIEIFQKGF